MDDVLLVTVDSLRADHVGHLGYERDTTPNIDALAAEGTYCTNAFAHACSTRPSFPAILTSVYPLMYGGYERVSEEQTLISEPFHEAGYETAGFHSNLYLSADFGYHRGFDRFYDSKTDPSPVAKLRQSVKDWLDEEGFVYQALARAIEVGERKAGANIGSAYVSATEITDMAIEWIRSTDDGSPSFLWVHYMDVHHPYVPPAEHQSPFRDETVGEREAIKLRRKMIEDPEAITESELSTLIDLYDAEIRYADTEIGRLVDTVLDEWGDDVTTLVTADHGEEFLDHGGFSHGATFYDEVIHVPFVLSPYSDGDVCDDLVGLLDVAPTLLDAADLDRPNEWEGKSLPEMIEGSGWPRERIIGDWKDYETDATRVCVRNHEWKYIHREDRRELYAIKDDPDETENVAEEYPDVTRSFEETVTDHREAIAATNVELSEVEMEESVKQRLRDLGYQE